MMVSQMSTGVTLKEGNNTKTAQPEVASALESTKMSLSEYNQHLDSLQAMQDSDERIIGLVQPIEVEGLGGDLEQNPLVSVNMTEFEVSTMQSADDVYVSCTIDDFALLRILAMPMVKATPQWMNSALQLILSIQC